MGCGASAPLAEEEAPTLKTQPKHSQVGSFQVVEEAPVAAKGKPTEVAAKQVAHKVQDQGDDGGGSKRPVEGGGESTAASQQQNGEPNKCAEEPKGQVLSVVDGGLPRDASGREMTGTVPVPMVRSDSFDAMNRALSEHYNIGKLLGKGNIAKTREATQKKTNLKVAIKILPREHPDFSYKSLMNEIEIMKKVDHPGCIRLHDVFEDFKMVYLVEDLATGGELFDRIVEMGSFSEKNASQYVKQMMDAIAYLHESGITHRDLKPENVLLKSNVRNSEGYDVIKIADFGLSSLKSQVNETMQTACGTPEYLAPELVAILSRRSKTKTYSYKVDVWAVGVILYVMLCGFHPFYHDNQLKLYMAILSGDFAYPSPYWDTIRQETKDFIKLLLQTDPDKRPSAAECLQHSWLIDVHSLNSSSISASNVAKLDSYNQRRHQKFKKGVHAVIAANRFAKMLGKPGMAATASAGAPTLPTTIEPIKE